MTRCHNSYCLCNGEEITPQIRKTPLQLVAPETNKPPLSGSGTTKKGVQISNPSHSSICDMQN